MEQSEKLNIGIGNLEPEKLKAENLKVQGIKIESVTKDGKEVGEKVVFLCKHPDREDLLNLSKVRYIKNDKVESSGTWYNLDAENKIVKASALASTLNFYRCNTLNDFVGKEVQTVLDGSYLVIKAY